MCFRVHVMGATGSIDGKIEVKVLKGKTFSILALLDQIFYTMCYINKNIRQSARYMYEDA